ncbi:Midasin [Pleurostoma richardsiae]|uniref:Midasin n=1 Tax=Pleurostoma richardsiae TaxID=41990 RepID=A0AA38RDJ4_9PEZI|nr:Midasin [Pleurostoma richardsiae]
MPRRTDDLDFEIHVDEPCLSATMDDETVAQPVEQHSHDEEAGTQDPAKQETLDEEGTATRTTLENDADNDDTIDDEPTDDVQTADAGEVECGDVQPLAACDEEPAIEEDEAQEEHTVVDDGADDEDDVDTPRPSHDTLDDESNDNNEEDINGSSRRESASSDRRHSLRTEALIQAAARAVVARIEKQDSRKSTDQDNDDTHSVKSSAERESYGAGGSEVSYDVQSISNRRGSSDSRTQITHNAHHSEGEGGDSSSQHDVDDDVFSDRSPRSSLGSSDEHCNEGTEKVDDCNSDRDYKSNFGRSPRLSSISGISDLSRYDKEFIPTARQSPRPAFRSPSSVRAIQMSSPAPSLFGSPRSAKRHTGLSGNGLPTISRLGSPTVSAQYSPKGRSTPPRFKIKKEAPLVLLHATLLPLRWPWGDVLNAMDSTIVHSRDGVYPYIPSESLKNLRDAWRQLQDRVGDTVLERGILLPHPQNDYEVLEERLLEALDLPLRRRARILQCGHYLGPANEMSLDDSEDDNEDEYESHSAGARRHDDKRHWCSTCQGEIKYEELGQTRVFRIKVYASNGLMKAGAWDACWKEMERVDIEVEPIIEPTIQAELEKLEKLQLEEAQGHSLEGEHYDMNGQEDSYVGEHTHVEVSSPPIIHGREVVETSSAGPQSSSPHSIAISSPAAVIHASPIGPPPTSAAADTERLERRHRDEERLREIYGHSSPQSRQREAHDAASTEHHPDSYMPPPTPPSPSEQAFERRESKRRTYQSASLSELLLESGRVLMQDRKNVVIALLSFLILFLAVRAAPGDASGQGGRVHETDAELLRSIYLQQQQKQAQEPAAHVYTNAMSQQTQETPVVPVVPSNSVHPAAMEPIASIVKQSSAVVADPCASQSQIHQPPVGSSPKPAETVTHKKVIRVFETVTETVKVTATEEPAVSNAETVEVEEPEYETIIETVKVTATESVAATRATENAAEPEVEVSVLLEESIEDSDQGAVPMQQPVEIGTDDAQLV